MKILAIYKHYWPDVTPYSRILRSILERAAADGHEVGVLTAQPGYNDIAMPPQPRYENLGGVNVHRVRVPREIKRRAWRRMLSFLCFLAVAAWRACTGKRPDVILVNVHPPLLMGLTCRLIKAMRGIPFVYHCQDLHPESARAAGRLGDGLVYRWLRSIDTGTCRAAKTIVTLSDDMAQTLEQRGVDAGKISIINNFILDAGFENCQSPSPVTSRIRRESTDFVVLFAGNLGHYQALDQVMAAARILAGEPDIRFLFLGDGAAKPDLERRAAELRDRTVFFEPYQPLPVAMQAMDDADLSLVSLAPGVHRVAYPSKTMMVLAAGCPVLAVVEQDSSLAETVRAHGLGLTCRQSAERIAATIRAARDERRHWRRRRPAIAAWAQAAFSRERTLEIWSELWRRL